MFVMGSDGTMQPMIDAGLTELNSATMMRVMIRNAGTIPGTSESWASVVLMYSPSQKKS